MLTVAHIVIHNDGNNSHMHIKFYQPEEDCKKGQVSEKDVQCFLCLVVRISNSERELN